MTDRVGIRFLCISIPVLPYNGKKAVGFGKMKRLWLYQAVKILGTAAFLTAAFFAGRQAAVMVDGYVQKQEAAGEKDDYSKMQKYCVVIDAGHGGGRLRRQAPPYICPLFGG